MKLKHYKIRQLYIQYLYRVKYNRVFNFYISLKILLKNKFLEKQFKALVVFYLICLNKKFRISYHKNICLFSGHKRSVFNFFKLNRLSIIEKINTLNFTGIKKAVW